MDQPPKMLGPYRILDALGEGAAGSVFLATPIEAKPFAAPGDLLAIKLYKDEMLKKPNQEKRIEREFRVGSTVTHPNVVTVHESGKNKEGKPFLVMEYVDGQPLSSWVEMYYPISDQLLLDIFAQVVAGVAELHRLDIFHRDLKPANIMVSGNFKAKVMDLGVVRPKIDALETPPDQFLATIRNSSPELLQNKQYDQRTDLYSLGTILYFLLHGEEVFAQEQQFVRLCQMVIANEPEFDAAGEQSAIRGQLLDLCKRLLAKSPDARPRNIDEVKKTISKERGSAKVSSRPLYAYVAAALTGLTPQNRQGIEFLGHSTAKACKTVNIYAHEPRKATDPVLRPDISPEAVYSFDRRRLVASDLLIGICNDPSFGMGQELEIAASYGIPIILVVYDKNHISRMVTGSFLNLIDDPIVYQSPDDFERKLLKVLKRNVAVLQNRKDRISKDGGAPLGQRLQELRNLKGWSVDEAARYYGVFARLVRTIENSSDFFHNVGFAVLKRISNALGLTLSDILSAVEVGQMSSPIVRDEANISLIEDVASTENWPARDLIEIRDEFRQEAAAKGNPPKFTREDIHKRHDALALRRLDESRTQPRLI